MAYLKKSLMRDRGVGVVAESVVKARGATAKVVRSDLDEEFDVFLSHSTNDRLLVVGVKDRIEEEGLTVYVDWINDTDLDRKFVTAKNARRLKLRMRRSRWMLYLATENSTDSKWMPWEVGYFDGCGEGRVGILPVLDDDNDRFKGVEFLSLYPVIEARKSLAGPKRLYLIQTGQDSVNLRKAVRAAKL